MTHDYNEQAEHLSGVFLQFMVPGVGPRLAWTREANVPISNI